MLTSASKELKNHSYPRIGLRLMVNIIDYGKSPDESGSDKTLRMYIDVIFVAN